MAERICDLHCDTLYEIRKNKTSLINNNGHLSLEKLNQFKSFIQVMAMWSDKRLTNDEAYDAFLDASSLLEREIYKAQERGYKVQKAVNGSEIADNEANGVSSVIFAVEGGKLLDCQLSRLQMLRNAGVRLLTLVWNGECPIGGAYDTDTGLTEFGIEVVKECFDIGIIPDVSHASDRMINEVIELAVKHSKPIVATHSNSRRICNHPRNLTDENYRAIIGLGGIVGISFAPEHLATGGANISDITKHIGHYYEIFPGGVCFGCDFDGVTELPDGINDVSDLNLIENAMTIDGYSKKEIEKIMYCNARNFLINNL